MAQNHQTSNPLFKALSKQYESEVASAYATLVVYFDNPVAIGEHPQHLDEMDKLVAKIADAVVVGSAIIDKINKSYQKDKNNIKLIANSARDFVQSLSTALNNVKE